MSFLIFAFDSGSINNKNLPKGRGRISNGNKIPLNIL